MPHRNLLVMERTYISLSLPVQGKLQHVGDILVSTEYEEGDGLGVFIRSYE